MSLFSSLNVGLRGLLAQQAALQTVGHNIANASNPAFSRQRVEFKTNIPRDLQFAQLGTGVNVVRISRFIDTVLERRIQIAKSAFGNLDIRQQTMERIEALLNEFSESDLSNALNEFFNSLQDLANNPQDISMRRQVIENGETLSQLFNTFGNRFKEMRQSADRDLEVMVNDVNRIITEIAELNERIVQAENAGVNINAANDLRDRRDFLLKNLAEIVEINPIEDSRGAVNVLVGSNYLVFDKNAFLLSTEKYIDRGVQVSRVRIDANGILIELRGGKMKGTVDARDEVITKFYDVLSELGRAVIFEINKIHTEGVGLRRFSDLTSLESVNPDSIPLGGTALATSGRVEAQSSSQIIADPSFIGFPNDIFNGLDILILTGPNRGQTRRVIDFDGSNGTIVFDRPFDKEFEMGDQFQITSFKYPIQNGSFELRVFNELTGQVLNFNITVDLDKSLPFPSDSTLQSIVDEINTEAGAYVTALITTQNRLRIQSNSADLTFTFGKDTSDFLAAIGLNTFFTGSGAADMAVNNLIKNTPEYLAAGKSNSPGDNSNIIEMLDLRERPVLNNGTATLEDFYQQIIGEVGVDTTEARDRAENQKALMQQLENERERISGVNLDEEAINMITYQRSFQAMARYIAVVNQLLETLIAI